jgi:hypothetical protein
VIDEIPSTTTEPVTTVVCSSDAREAIRSCVISLQKMMETELQIRASFVGVTDAKLGIEVLPFAKQAQLALNVMQARQDQAKSLLSLIGRVNGLAVFKRASIMASIRQYIEDAQSEIIQQKIMRDSLADLSRKLLQAERTEQEKAMRLLDKDSEELRVMVESYELLDAIDTDWMDEFEVEQAAESRGSDGSLDYELIEAEMAQAIEETDQSNIDDV